MSANAISTPPSRRHAYGGLWIPLVTPFRDGRLDLTAARQLTDTFANAGCHGLIVAGTTGEAATTSDDEQRQLLDAVAEANAGRMKLAIGLGGNDTQAVARIARQWRDSPAQAMLLSPPAYTRPSQAGLIAHFEHVIDASSLPTLLYNHPLRTGVNLSVDTVRRLAERQHVVGIKESAGENIDQLYDLITQTDLAILVGEDKLMFTSACLGADGAIAACAHVRPELYVRMLADIRAGQIDRARATFTALMPLIRLLFAEPNPAVLKAALASQGLITEEVRLPMLPASAAVREPLARVLADVMRLD